MLRTFDINAIYYPFNKLLNSLLEMIRFARQAFG